MPLTYGSLFTGIAGFDEGFEAAGMQCLWQVEIDQTCNRILRRRYPERERFHDVRDCGRHNLKPVDVICGGFPCQDLSLAGLRAGLAGARSGLWREFLRILGELRPRLCVIENVPGLLSSWTPVEPPPGDLAVGAEWETEESSDFETILLDLCELDYCVAAGVLDSQYFRVPQRRDRVFIIGSLGERGGLAGESARDGGGLLGLSAQILFESESVRGDSPPSRRSGQRPALTLSARTSAGGGLGTDFDCDGGLVTVNRMLAFGEYVDDDSASTLKQRDYKDATDLIVAPLTAANHHADQVAREPQLVVMRTAQTGANGCGIEKEERAYTLDGSDNQAVAFKPSHFTRGKDGPPTDITPPLTADADKGDQDPIVFTQNQRDEVRQMEVAGAIGTIRRGDTKNETLIGEPIAYRTSGNSGAFEQGDKISALNCGTDKTQHVITTSFQSRLGRNGRGTPEEELAPALNGVDAGATSDMRPCVQHDMIVRRLTPRECERLQGLEDDWTRYADNGQELSDSARYRMCGNAVTRTVAEWLGHRIVAVLGTTSEPS